MTDRADLFARIGDLQVTYQQTAYQAGVYADAGDHIAAHDALTRAERVLSTIRRLQDEAAEAATHPTAA